MNQSPTPLKAISLWQPWASLWVLLLKHFETRHWKTPYKGPLAVHAAMTKNAELLQICEEEPFKSALKELGFSNFMSLPRGVILGVCDKVDCYQVATPAGGPLPNRPFLVNGAGKVQELSERERAFGDFSNGRFAWEPKNMRALKDPIPCKGAQGLWDVPPDIAAAVWAQLA